MKIKKKAFVSKITNNNSENTILLSQREIGSIIGQFQSTRRILNIYSCFESLIYNKKMNKEEYQNSKSLRKTFKYRHSAVILSQNIDLSFPKFYFPACQVSLNRQQLSFERIHHSNQGFRIKSMKTRTTKMADKTSKFKFQQTKIYRNDKMELQSNQKQQYCQRILFNVKSINFGKKDKKHEDKGQKLIKINKVRSKSKKNKKKSIHEKENQQIRQKESKKQLKPQYQKTENTFQQQQQNHQGNERRAIRRQTYMSLLTQISQLSKRDSFSILKFQQLSSLRNYYTFLKTACSQINISFKQVESYSKGQLKYKIPAAHNNSFIQKAMNQRWWWQQSKQVSSNIIVQNICFVKYQDIKNIVKADEQSKICISQNTKQLCKPGGLAKRSMSSHFSNGKYLSNPICLSFIINQGNQEFFPMSFYIDRYRGENWYNFTRYFFSKENLKDDQSSGNYKRQWIIKNGQYSTLKVFKILSSFQQIKQFIVMHTKDDRSYVIQEYINNQFLLDEQKIDIHAFILVTNLNGVINSYWYDDGFVEIKQNFKQRPSSAQNRYFESFKIDRYDSVKKIENKISFEDFETYCHHLRKNKFSFRQSIAPLMKQAAINFLLSSHTILKQQGAESKFQIFELKFVIDSLLKPWLINVCTFPCKPASTPILEKLYSSLVDDSLKLSIDLVYPPPLNWPASKQLLLAPTCGSTKFDLIFQSTNAAPGKKAIEIPFLQKMNKQKITQSEKKPFQFKSCTCPFLQASSHDFS